MEKLERLFYSKARHNHRWNLQATDQAPKFTTGIEPCRPGAQKGNYHKCIQPLAQYELIVILNYFFFVFFYYYASKTYLGRR